MVIVTFYGLPIQALPIISAIGVVVDPPATMVNATGDTVAGMLVTRQLEGKEWMDRINAEDQQSAVMHKITEGKYVINTKKDVEFSPAKRTFLVSV